MAYLGIDLGTSGLRILLIDEAGTPLASAQAHYDVQRPHPGWSEQAPADWIAALEAAISEIGETTPEFAQIRGIGVAGHMHGAVLLDETDTVLRPCILWNDTRSHVEATRLDGIPDFRSLSGNIVFPGFTAPKLDWVRTQEPDIFKRIAKVLLPAAFLNLYLTGEYVSDVSDAAGTSWLDVAHRAWSDTLLGHGGLSVAAMPRLVEGSEPAGQLRADLQRRWGMDHAVTVAGGAADNAAAACGMGVMNEGQGFVSLGTSGVVLAARNICQPAPETAVHTFCHAVPDRWYQMGVMLSATDSLNWLSTVVGQSPGELTQELGSDLKDPSTLMFLPYLSGERTPHNDAAIRGGFVGLSTTTTRADMTRAVLEGVSFGLRDCLDAIRDTGTSMETLFAIGGGAASDYWLALLATVLETPLRRPEGGEFGAALGAARLGQVAATDSQVDDVMHRPANVTTFVPQDYLVTRYQAAHDRFRRAYLPLRGMM